LTVPPTIAWDEHNLQLQLLDQRQLPETIHYLDITSLAEACEAISTLAVRGAPAIGIAAAYALVICAKQAPADQLTSVVESAATALKAARPTAVNLAWAVDRLLDVSRAAGELTALNPLMAPNQLMAPNRLMALHQEAQAIHQQDREICQAIGNAGRHLITSGCRVLTHCNAGALAVSELGTATAPMYLSHQDGVDFKVFAGETRPLLQGARLTAWELDRAGIDVTLICDNAAASLMAQGAIDLVLVGTDRVTANGDVVNKIGTLNLAVLCHHYQIPFYVACPSSTFDPDTATGADVQIEQRGADEVISGRAAAVKALNPAFDVTPAALVTALVTDLGLLDYSVDNPLEPLLKHRGLNA
jgi:methylthioribose-1-phosphate isomerase